MVNSIKQLTSGKVRDIFELNALILQTTDRVSAYNSILGGLVPQKGIVLQTISNMWMELLSEFVSNHIISYDPNVLAALGFGPESYGRTVLAQKHVMLPVECIVRGYYIPTSHSWDQYKVDNTIQGIQLPAGLRESEKLPKAIFTPTTKDEHDTPLKQHEFENHLDDFIWNYFGQQLKQLSVVTISELSNNVANKLKEVSILLYNKAAEYADKKGIILADTKLEFGIVIKDTSSEDIVPEFELILCDEAFTPDSSRYWDKASYEVGKTQASMDKQYLRDYLRNELCWTGLKDGPIPEIPDEVYMELSRIYKNILYRLFDVDLDKN